MKNSGMIGARLAALLFLAACLPAQTPTCLWAITGAVVKCVPLSSIAVPGPAGPQGIPGPPGPQGPPGVSGTGGSITGGPCVSADGSLALFVKLPDGSCLPVIPTGSFIVKTAGVLDKNQQPVPIGSVATVAGLELLASGGVVVSIPGR